MGELPLDASSTSGWSAVGGQTANPYALDRNPSGSSSGSAAGVAAGLAPSRSVPRPTARSSARPAPDGIVGIKPSHGLVSRRGIVPISPVQDTAGPMARSVADTAALLAVLAGTPAPDRPYVTLYAARLGLWRPAGSTPRHRGAAARRRRAVRAGATVVPVELDAGVLEADEWPALVAEFRAEIGVYLAATPGAAVRSLDELVRFNADDPVELSRFGQEIFEQALAAPPVSDATYREQRSRATATARRMIDEALGGGGGLRRPRHAEQPAGVAHRLRRWRPVRDFHPPAPRPWPATRASPCLPASLPGYPSG